MADDKRYIVRNPRGIDPGTRILLFSPPDSEADEQAWYEGDEFVRPTQMSAKDVAAWVKSGFLEEE